MAVLEREPHSNAAACLDCALGYFDWSLKHAVSGGTLASVDKPLLRPGLYVYKPSSKVEEAGIGRVLVENQMRMSVGEFGRDQLQAVIRAMGTIEQALEGADCATYL